MDGVGGVSHKEHPSREPWACSHSPPWLGGLSVTPGDPRGKGTERSGTGRGAGPAVAMEGGYPGKAPHAPRQSRAAAVSARFLK